MTNIVIDSTMELITQCPAGQVSLIKEGPSEYTGGGLTKPISVQEDEAAMNPWGLVVAVGDPVVTRTGLVIPQPCEPGNSVAFARSGIVLNLVSYEGQSQPLYVVPFEAILQIQAWKCRTCGWTTRTQTRICEQCSGLVVPTAAQIQAVS